MTSKPESHEDRLEPLLVEFFRAEMPVELRDPAFGTPEFEAGDVSMVPGPVRGAARSASPVTSGGASGGRGGLAVVGVVAACLLAVLIGIPGRAPIATPDSESSTAASDPAAADVAGPDPAFTLTTDDVFVEHVDGRVETFGTERIETNGGPVELRTVRETTNVSVFDPETGNGVDVTSEVLDIEIIPIDEPEKPAWDELPDPREDAPLPPEFGSP